jgi:hypothetical protein
LLPQLFISTIPLTPPHLKKKGGLVGLIAHALTPRPSPRPPAATLPSRYHQNSLAYIYKFNVVIYSKNGVNTNIISNGFGTLFRVGLGPILSGVEVEFLLDQVKNYAAICGKLWGTF